jgi:hypothetical protein
MSDVRMQFRYHGQVLRVDPDVYPWELRSETGPVDWRVILLAPDLASFPVVLVDQGDMDSLEEQLDLCPIVPGDLRIRLMELLPSGESTAGSDVQAEAAQGRLREGGDEELIAACKELREKYKQLHEEAPQLPLNSGALFIFAHERGLFGSLELLDDRPPADKDPVPVPRLPQYLPDLAAVAEPGFEARACVWDGDSVLYEDTWPRTAAGIKPGRCLLLHGNGKRTDLGFLEAKDLAQTDPGRPVQTNARFQVRAADTN